MNTGLSFYDPMAQFYHLIFADWEASMRHQGDILAALLPSPDVVGPVLDCACGIGTQCLPLARLGFRMDASDLAAAAVDRARREAADRGLAIRFRVDDMRTLATAPVGQYGAVLCLDNALPHCDSDAEIAMALEAMRDRLRPSGRLLLSLRDYEPLMRERPASLPPRFFNDAGGRRIVFQVWDWLDARRYVVHQYLSRQTGQGWRDQHFVGRYRAVTGGELVLLAERTGFSEVRLLAPADTGFYQPVLAALRP